MYLLYKEEIKTTTTTTTTTINSILQSRYAILRMHRCVYTVCTVLATKKM